MSFTCQFCENQLQFLHADSTQAEKRGPFEIVSERQEKRAEKNQMNVKYVAFILKYCQLMDGRPGGKLWKVYEVMAEFMGTRNVSQCKLHHQRMVQKYGKIGQIAQNLAVQDKQLMALVNQQKSALNHFITRKIELFTASKAYQKMLEKCEEQPFYMPKFNQTAGEYRLELTLLKTFYVKPPVHSEQEGNKMSVAVWREWAVRLNNFFPPSCTTLY